jgi:nitrile hydratase accessory protein
MTLDRGFDAPWQAQAFAMVEALKASGRLSGADWAERLGAELAAGQINPEDYWTCYLHAFEAMLAETGFAPPQQVEDLTQAWHRAARATPHGKPITLDADPGA